MKAFGMALATAVVLAIGASVILEGTLGRTADETYAAPSVRLSEDNTVQYRNFMGH
ncbi:MULTISPECIES: hypothetical protein [Azospirillum]|uniref:Uncharacterized protein n=1 Tax=Azospirillum argentinense TaxID=2970906 RepID=A0A5B0KP08_9PROT|nr:MULTISPECIES: hypothetical protein [Azospirillum]KAA1053675.1 hypothetical protein FH063_002643 [Azospirillum argentinense]TWA58736.1 hypothetical protein FBZ84_117130 [Azospirillum baldaniorum]